MVGEVLSLSPVDLLVGKPEARCLEVTVKKTLNVRCNFGEEIGVAVR
jgi:hypothetical protein